VTPDQVRKLQEVAQRLVDVLAHEADPATWPGAGKAATELTREEWGHRKWSKKNAVLTAALCGRVHDLAKAAAPAALPEPARAGERGDSLVGEIREIEEALARRNPRDAAVPWRRGLPSRDVS